MKYTASLTIKLNEKQAAQLKSLHLAFSEICNALVPWVIKHRCWNRVALHHLTYYVMRARFPEIGSQMVSNAIYSVCRTYRIIFASRNFPLNISKTPEAELPVVVFLPAAHVYFDRHTLSIKNNILSLYTLDGRMRCEVNLSPEDLDRFHREKLKEVSLLTRDNHATLNFLFGTELEQSTIKEINLPENVLLLEDYEKSQSLVA